MKREEEIEKQGTIYSDISGNYIEWGDGWQDYDDQVYVEKAFIEGAKWADETMIDRACEWLQRELVIATENVENIKEFHTIVARRYNDMNALIEGFKKAMEL